jgi:hypothetical protein
MRQVLWPQILSPSRRRSCPNIQYERTRKFNGGGDSGTKDETPGDPGKQVIAFYLIFGLFLSAGGVGLVALVMLALLDWGYGCKAGKSRTT